MADGADPYSDPVTGVLHNRLDITDAVELDRLKSDIVGGRIIQLRAQPILGRYDLAHLQAVHRHLFQDLYDWAGQPRTVAIAKYGQDLYALPQHLKAEAGRVLGGLAREQHLQGLGHEQTIDRLAHYMGELHAVHPFREGNSRSGRAFFGQLAGERGLEIPWQDLSWEQMEHAKRHALHFDSTLLRDLLAEHARPLAGLDRGQPGEPTPAPPPLLERVLGPRPATPRGQRLWDRGDTQLTRLAERTGITRLELDELRELPEDRATGPHVERAMERLAELRDQLGRSLELPEPADALCEHVADLAVDLDRRLDR